ncbi:TonB-dependent receptor [hydrothermal vent metagenome]|uniref:TonB-dependent receptor n=1 Tax=hydrothermal vent metagenome TaxID=652676 RepID=A0A3B1C7A4_9ZZZZ
MILTIGQLMKLFTKFNKAKFLSSLIVILIITSLSVYGGSTGKISGTVTDAVSGDPLIGVNVVLAEITGIGAATDVNGQYVILNIPPGTYTVKFSMIGFKTVDMQGVRVFIDRTIKVNVELQEETYEGETVLVVAKREEVEMDRTNTASYVNSEEIKALPVTDLKDVIQLQAGVIKDAGGNLHIRGGRSREIAYMIDGVPVTNTFSQGGGSNVNVENNMVSELQVITGTFNAEYGSAQSGVINVVTRVPDQNLDGNVESYLGGYYSPNTPQYVGGVDNYDILNNIDMRFSLSVPLKFVPQSLGKMGILINGRVLDDKGYLYGERRFMPEDGWEISVYREWYRAIYDPPDLNVIPLPSSLHTGDGAIVAMDWKKAYNVSGKFVYQPIAGITASYSIYVSSDQSSGFSNSWKFLPDAMPTWYSDNITHMFVFTHTPSDNLYYNIRYSYQTNEDKKYMYESANDPRYQTTAVNAWDPGVVTGYDMGGINSWDRNNFKQKVHLVNADITWQINKIVEIKAGGEFKAYDFYYKRAPMKPVLGYESLQFPYTQSEIRGLELPYEYFREATKEYEYGKIKLREASPDSTADDLFYVEYNRKPMDGAAYAQTTLSMGEVVFNAGVRFDFFWTNDRWAPTYSNVFPELVGDDRYYEKVKPKYQVSPRFGLSFPISDAGALRLSYGHFFQQPSYEKMYANPVLPHFNQFSIANTIIGNPNLKAEKTIQYEIGVQQALMPGFAMELSVFYKDIRDLLGIELLTLSNATTFRRYINKEYGSSSGVTFSVNYRSTDGSFAANVDYTYMKAKGTASSPEAALDVQILSGSSRGAYTLAKRRMSYLNWDQTHSLNATVSIRPLMKTLISIITRMGSGLPYTPSTLGYGIDLPTGWWENIERKPFNWTVDLRLSQGFVLLGLDFLASVNVFNLFDQQNELRVHPVTGRAGPNAYLPEIARIRYRRIKQLGEFTPTEADYNPTWYSRPRFIQLGLALQF